MDKKRDSRPGLYEESLEDSAWPFSTTCMEQGLASWMFIWNRKAAVKSLSCGEEEVNRASPGYGRWLNTAVRASTRWAKGDRTKWRERACRLLMLFLVFAAIKTVLFFFGVKDRGSTCLRVNIISLYWLNLSSERGIRKRKLWVFIHRVIFATQ